MWAVEQADERSGARTAGAQLDDWREALLKRARFLPDCERALVEMYLRGELHGRRVAAVMGVSQSTVSRRARRLVHRLGLPIVGELTATPRAPGISDEFRDVALRFHVLKEPMAHIARSEGKTVDQVRAMLAYVDVWKRNEDARRREERGRMGERANRRTGEGD